MCSSVLLFMCCCLLSASVADNVALRRPANQTGVDLVGSSAQKAVDGDVNTCTEIYVKYPNNATWWVDLGTQYAVDDVVVRNTDNILDYVHLEQFTISVSDDEHGIREVCGTYTSTVPRGGSATIPCSGEFTRWIWFEKVGGNDSRVATLCEVDVHGMSRLLNSILVPFAIAIFILAGVIIALLIIRCLQSREANSTPSSSIGLDENNPRSRLCTPSSSISLDEINPRSRLCTPSYSIGLDEISERSTPCLPSTSIGLDEISERSTPCLPSTSIGLDDINH